MYLAVRQMSNLPWEVGEGWRASPQEYQKTIGTYYSATKSASKWISVLFAEFSLNVSKKSWVWSGDGKWLQRRLKHTLMTGTAQFVSISKLVILVPPWQYWWHLMTAYQCVSCGILFFVLLEVAVHGGLEQVKSGVGWHHLLLKNDS